MQPTDNILLTRDEFRNSVFKRDNYKCVCCGQPAVDAHHIIDRSLFIMDNEKGGYFIDNGVSLCAEHHLLAEDTTISCKELRVLAKIDNIIYPKTLSLTEFVKDYDKWGNPILKNFKRLKGYQFEQRKHLFKPNTLALFNKAYDMIVEKYPRTYHLQCSPGTTSDDRISKNINKLYSEHIIISEKLDGENCLDAATLLQTELDGYKTIQWLCENKYNGRVLTYNIDSDSEEFQYILKWSVLENNDDWFELELDDGKTLILTSEHRVWLTDLQCYRKVKDLKPGDDFLLKR